MKRTISGLIFLSIIGCIVYLYYSFGLFTPYNYFSAKSAIESGKPELILFNENDPTISARNELATKYGFSIKQVKKVDLNIAEENGIEVYNNIITEYLNSLNRADWKSEFERKVDSLTVVKNVLKEPIVQELNETLKTRGNDNEKIIIQKIKNAGKDAHNVVVQYKRNDGALINFYYYRVYPPAYYPERIVY